MSVVRSKDCRSAERQADRRVYARAHKIVPVWYRHEGKDRRGCALDLGTEGACLIAEVAFAASEEFELVLQLEEELEVRASARVLWSDPAPDQKTHMLGVSFKSFKSGDKAALGSWVQRYSRV